jgi:hypothetical protein
MGEDSGANPEELTEPGKDIEPGARGEFVARADDTLLVGTGTYGAVFAVLGKVIGVAGYSGERVASVL